MDDEKDVVYKTALMVLTKRLDEFVKECVDEKGKPKAPSAQAVAKIRGYLNVGCEMAYPVKAKP